MVKIFNFQHAYVYVLFTTHLDYVGQLLDALQSSNKMLIIMTMNTNVPCTHL